MITKGSVVNFEYTLSDEDGKVIESNKGEKPITYTHGEHQIIPGLETGLLGMEVNEEKRICVQPEDGYGPVNPDGFKEVSKNEIPAESLQVGALLRARGPEGEDFSVRILDVKPETVVLDLNHPLAGLVLNFDVRILSIQTSGSE